MAGLARAASANGYAALALSLRGWLGSEGESDQGLRQPLDVLAAIDWLAKRPLVDRERMALVGASMGGQVALLAAAHKPPIRAVASFYAPHRPGALARGQSLHPRLSRRSVRARRACRCARRSCGWRRSTHRCCWSTATATRTCRSSRRRPWPKRCKSHGKEVETFIVPGGTHFFTEQQNAQARRKLFDFLRRHLNRS